MNGLLPPLQTRWLKRGPWNHCRKTCKSLLHKHYLYNSSPLQWVEDPLGARLWVKNFLMWPHLTLTTALHMRKVKFNFSPKATRKRFLWIQICLTLKFLAVDWIKKIMLGRLGRLHTQDSKLFKHRQDFIQVYSLDTSNWNTALWLEGSGLFRKPSLIPFPPIRFSPALIDILHGAVPFLPWISGPRSVPADPF